MLRKIVKDAEANAPNPPHVKKIQPTDRASAAPRKR